MNINKIGDVINFGRAFSTNEKKSYERLIQDTSKVLGIKDTTAIIFDFNVPSESGYNVAIGTTFSDYMKNFSKFLKSMMGITSIQMQPQGQITPSNTSPYSGTNYAFGEHIIDLKKLSSVQYANILSEQDVKELDSTYSKDKKMREYKTDYKFVLGSDDEEGVISKKLRIAYLNFKDKLKSNDTQAKKLNNEFETFKNKNKHWLQKHVLFETLAKIYKTRDFSKWDDIDKNLFEPKIPDKVRENRIREIESQFKGIMEFESFKQFIADKQQKETRNFLNSENIKLYGDCLIGFSESEKWANKACFEDDLYYGGPDPECSETNCIQTWGLDALDYTKLGECNEDGDISNLGEVGKLLYEKYRNFFTRYDGIRMDAAWQFVTPFIYRAVNGNYEEVKMPDINFTILNIMKAAAKDSFGEKFNEDNPDNIMLELVGLSAGKSREITLNKYPHLYTTAYAEYDEYPAAFLRKGYQDDKFYVGVGCHDNDSLVNMAENKEKRELHLREIMKNYNLHLHDLDFNAGEYIRQNKETRLKEKFRTAKFSEIFTAPKHFFTLPDAFGMSERINISGKKNENNWTLRIPSDYERFYFSQLMKGYGINLPKVLANAMKMKNIDNPYLIEKCNEAAEILRSEGPLCEDSANISEKHGMLSHKFDYIS